MAIKKPSSVKANKTQSQTADTTNVNQTKSDAKPESTVVFGRVLEKGNYLKTPKALIHIRAFDNPTAKKIKPRHIHFLLVLAAKKYKTRMIRRYWSSLARDLGVSTDTARKWAYELRDIGVIRIISFTGKKRLPTPKPTGGRIVNPGLRNDANGFDIAPLITLLIEAAAAYKAAREAARKARQEGTPQ